jgi:hypothetical protein
LALLLIEGPLARLPEPERQAVLEQTIDTFVRSFWTARGGLQAPQS